MYSSAFGRIMAKNSRQLLLISSSQVHGHEYLQHSKNDITAFLAKHDVKKVLFVPYAQFDYDAYTRKVSEALAKFGLEVNGIHEHESPVAAIEAAQAIFIGGGNTFVLLNTLYEQKLIEPIRKCVRDKGVPYMSTSAGTNVATVSIQTTNDMPITQPPTFAALDLVPFNINPHYLDADETSKHKGETRETRIMEFHQVNETPVLGLREGSCVLVDGDKASLIGDFSARLFQKGKAPTELEKNSDLSFLLKWNAEQIN